jgi:dihydrofolate synthase/folylpolyglutamate synthase
MFQRVGKAAYKANLDNTLAICNLLENPQDKFRSVHIAGTNGKGSTAHLLAAVLQSSGLKTGLYTSPHLKDFRERIRINGKMIPQSYVAQFIAQHLGNFEQIKPSFFEMTVGMAFQYFAEEKVDIAVIETGMGGRLDSTNVLTPLLSIITNIGLDHTQFLGDTIKEIALEKAAIIKPGVPVIIGETQEQTKGIFIQKAKQENATIKFADQEFMIRDAGTEALRSFNVFRNKELYLKGLACPLGGNYQSKNIITTIQAIEKLRKQGIEISSINIIEGIGRVKELTGIRGRWEILSESPLAICDVGHNVDGIVNILEQLNRISFNKLHFVFGMVNDKHSDRVLELLPKDAIYYFCKPNIPRGLDQKTLQEVARKYDLTGETFTSVAEAYSRATDQAGKDDLVFIGGSTFVVAEVL